MFHMLNDKIIEKLSKLSALCIPDSDKPEIIHTMNDIEQFIAKIDSFNEELEENESACEILVKLREDIPTKSSEQTDILQNSDEADNGFFHI